MPRQQGPGPRGPTEVVHAEKIEHALVKEFRLRVLEGPDTGKTMVSTGDRLIIGTHESAGFILTDRAVSRFHCDISLVEGSPPVLRDLGSRNGTVVDGVSILQAHLRSGALLAVGRTKLHFELGEGDVRIPLSERERFGRMVGRSTAIRAIFARLESAAPSEATVLLEGETGTGKDIAAESLHRESPRANGPFVVVDCGAIPSDLLESELFGHEKGAFTGAISERTGAFEAASGGTLFLDEVGELAIELQPKLLRALDRHEIRRVGTTKHVPVDVRVIAATHRNLRAEVNANRFRPDLYYRLAVLEIRMPPLRERTEDLPLLVESILVSMEASDRPEAALLRTPEFQDHLLRHAWPGNIRELRNYIERSLALRETSPFGSAPGSTDAPAGPFNASKPLKEAREAWTRAFERRYLEAVMERSGGNVSAAARAAGLDRIYFYRLLWKHQLK